MNAKMDREAMDAQMMYARATTLGYFLNRDWETEGDDTRVEWCRYENVLVDVCSHVYIGEMAAWGAWERGHGYMGVTDAFEQFLDGTAWYVEDREAVLEWVKGKESGKLEWCVVHERPRVALCPVMEDRNAILLSKHEAIVRVEAQIKAYQEG